MYFHQITHFHDYGKILIYFDVQMYFFSERRNSKKDARRGEFEYRKKLAKIFITLPPIAPPEQVTKDHNEIPGEVNFVMHDSNLLRICLNN